VNANSASRVLLPSRNGEKRVTIGGKKEKKRKEKKRKEKAVTPYIIVTHAERRY